MNYIILSILILNLLLNLYIICLLKQKHYHIKYDNEKINTDNENIDFIIEPNDISVDNNINYNKFDFSSKKYIYKNGANKRKNRTIIDGTIYR